MGEIIAYLFWPMCVVLIPFLYKLATKIIFGIYLKNERVKIIEQKLPDCVYKPSVNKLGKWFMLRFAATPKYHTPLGHFSFIGEYDDVKIEDFVCVSPGDPDRDDDPTYYYETILIYCEVPPDNILNRYKYVSYITLKDTDILPETNKIVENVYQIKNTNLVVEFKKKETCQSEWIYALEHGLADKLVEFFKTYKPDDLHFAKNKLILSFNEGIGSKNKLRSSNDNFVHRIDEIYDTVGKLHELVNWRA